VADSYLRAGGYGRRGSETKLSQEWCLAENVCGLVLYSCCKETSQMVIKTTHILSQGWSYKTTEFYWAKMKVLRHSPSGGYWGKSSAGLFTVTIP
jgi:hypothetical protein